MSLLHAALRHRLVASSSAVIMFALLMGKVFAGPFEDGESALEKGDYTSALRLFEQLAEEGDPRAQYRLGGMYDYGSGVTQDYQEAARWYHRAADQGLSQAQCDLAAMYYSGDGVRQSFPEAVRYYRLAADQGSALAQASLADMYRSGVGLPQDHTQALRLYREAAARGNAGAMHNIGWFYAEGIVVEVDFVQAYSWYQLAIERWKPWQEQQRMASIHHRDLLGEFMTKAEIADAMNLVNAWKQTKVDPPL